MKLPALRGTDFAGSYVLPVPAYQVTSSTVT
jgi:hypothetical protein